MGCRPQVRPLMSGPGDWGEGGGGARDAGKSGERGRGGGTEGRSGAVRWAGFVRCAFTGKGGGGRCSGCRGRDGAAHPRAANPWVVRRGGDRSEDAARKGLQTRSRAHIACRAAVLVGARADARRVLVTCARERSPTLAEGRPNVPGLLRRPRRARVGRTGPRTARAERESVRVGPGGAVRSVEAKGSAHSCARPRDRCRCATREPARVARASESDEVGGRKIGGWA